MANLQIQDIPDLIYSRIQALATEKNRSIDEEVINLLTQALQSENLDLVSTTSQSGSQILQKSISQRQELSAQHPWLDSTDLVREDRER
jgi:plasmid stability protein